MTVRAKFPGECRRCPNPIIPGEEVLVRQDDVIHASCASGADDDPTPAVKSGESVPCKRGHHAGCNGRRRGGKLCGCECHTEKKADPVATLIDAGATPFEDDKGHGLELAVVGTALPEKPHGFIDDLDEETYHAHQGSLSHSGAKLILKAPAHYKYALTHPKHKNEFDFGTAAHAEVLGVGAEIVVHEYDADKVKSPKATNAWKAEQSDVRARGAVLLLPEEYAKVREMADVLSSHRLAMRLLSEGKPEVSAFVEDEETGVLKRARFDWLGSSILDDYKSTVCSEPGWFVRQAANLGYHSQAAWYSDVAAELGHPADAFAFIAQEKEPPYLVTVIELPPELVDAGRARNRRALQMFRDCTESGLWPGYVPDDTFAQPAAPRWALREEETYS